MGFETKEKSSLAVELRSSTKFLLNEEQGGRRLFLRDRSSSKTDERGWNRQEWLCPAKLASGFQSFLSDVKTLKKQL